MRRPGRLTSTLLLAAFLAPIAGPAPHAFADGPDARTHGPERAADVAAAAPAAPVAAPAETPADDCCTTAHEGCAAASCSGVAGCGLTPVAVRDPSAPERAPAAALRLAADASFLAGPATDPSVPPPRV